MASYAAYNAYKNGGLSSVVREGMSSVARKEYKSLLELGKIPYKKVNDSLMDRRAWESFSSAEKDAVKQYTGNAFKYINKYLRGEGNTLNFYEKAMAKAYIGPLKNALDKCTIKNYITTYRGCSVSALEKLFGGVELSKMNQGSLKKFVGATVKDGGFFSTSPAIPFSGKVRMSIICPPGTKGLYVDPVSKCKGEKELLLQAGTAFEICDIVKDSTGNFNVVLKAIIEEMI